MTTLSLGFTAGHDQVGRKDIGFFDTAPTGDTGWA